MIRVLDIIEDTVVDGPGFRTSIYCAGCSNHCPGCQNPSSWPFSGGRPMKTEEIMDVIRKDEYANVTFSGGDPMFQAKGFTKLAKAIKKETGKNIWCYTGMLFERLLEMEPQRRLLNWIDVLVDGPFIESKKDPDLLFRGSSNQRLIDVQASLKSGRVELFHCDVHI